MLLTLMYFFNPIEGFKNEGPLEIRAFSGKSFGMEFTLSESEI